MCLTLRSNRGTLSIINYYIIVSRRVCATTCNPLRVIDIFRILKRDPLCNLQQYRVAYIIENAFMGPPHIKIFFWVKNDQKSPSSI